MSIAFIMYASLEFFVIKYELSNEYIILVMNLEINKPI